MAFANVTKRATSGDGLVYTVPAGKQAEILSMMIANTASPAGDATFSLRWTHSNTSRTADFYSGITLSTGEMLNAFAPGFLMNASDTLSVIVTEGQTDSVLSLNVTP